MPEQRKAYWRFDRDQTNRVSTERIGRDQPVADLHAPVAVIGRDPDSAEPDGPSSVRHAAQIRGAIDDGRARDKIAYPDPAAAPLGTDDEAAGTTPGRERVEIAARHEMGGEAGPGELADPDRGRWLGLFLTVLALAAVAAVGLVVVSSANS